MSKGQGYVGARLARLGAQLPHLARALLLVWTAARRWTIVWSSLLLFQGLLPVATVYLTRALVDSLAAALGPGAAGSIRPALLFAALMAVVLLVGEGLRGAAAWVRAAQSELVQDHIQGLIHNKSAAADLAFYESPDFYDHLHRARSGAAARSVAMVESLGSFLQNSLTLAAMGLVLIPYGPWLPAALLVSTLPALVVVVRHARVQHDWRIQTTGDERRTWYYDWILTSGEAAAEVRLFGLGSHFRGLYQDLRNRLREERLELARRQGKAEMAAGILGLGVTCGTLGWMIWRASRGQATLGDLALFYQAFNQGLRLMRSLLENVGQIYANSLYLGNLFEFLALEPKVVNPPEPAPVPVALPRSIRFHRVTFRYPASARPALNDFSLDVPAGGIVAIVGSNGAGKSTLLKLLCRFYDPEEGRIELDGVDIRTLPLEGLRRQVTVLFQQPVRYNTTVAENIALGELAAADQPGAVHEAAAAAGASEIIARLPNGYHQVLGKWFVQGTELSVGEWQRIALARAFLRRAPILVLDEPTSAMDPWAEADWLRRFRELSAGRTALIITHRFTTAMYADRIHVMADGRIVESGRHEELLARGGRYAEGWKAQAGGCTT